MADEEQLTDGYSVLQSVTIGGFKIVLGENPDAEKPYMTWRRSLNEPFGAEKHLLPTYSGDYLTVLKEFIRTQSIYADGLALDRVYRGSPADDAALTAADCVPGGMDADLAGKVVVIKASVLSPEYRACSYQLMLAESGFGCSPESNGRAVYGTNLYSGEKERWNRSDILGVAADNAIPGWARDKLAAIRPAYIEPASEPVPESVSEPVSERQMDKEQFWLIIDSAREKAGSWHDMYEPLLEALTSLEAPDILRWKQIFDEYQKLSYKDKLWAAASAMMGGCSDDSFDYFRGWLTAQGKEAFMNALADPDSLIELESVRAYAYEIQGSEYVPMSGYRETPRFDEIISAARFAYESKPGQSGDFYSLLAANPLKEQEKADLSKDIVYAEDIDTKWFDWDAGSEEILERQKKLVPKLYGLFHAPKIPQASVETPLTKRPDDKESVLGKLYNARNTAVPRKPKQNKPYKGGQDIE